LEFEVLKVFSDGLRKYAVIRSEGKNFLSWKSHRAGTWLVSPFMLDFAVSKETDLHWILKGKAEEIPGLPSNMVDAVEKIRAPVLSTDGIKKELKKFGLLRKSPAAEKYCAEAMNFYRRRGGRVWLADEYGIWHGMKRVGLEESRKELLSFYRRFKLGKPRLARP
jgi:hypothetical protein